MTNRKNVPQPGGWLFLKGVFPLLDALGWSGICIGGIGFDEADEAARGGAEDGTVNG